ncbi:long-chain fatty acid--CoA ligase [uncultured Bifidobacterium sp.]|uniref:AMP-dependent synthetase/ligase n=1 Tax=uncultured Bifidobacterium sp. TaxID=165187 RepID=UPI002609AE13|nr:long-chain fatty acid--CoA ligase [uncultured Bifidobacterium sp.]
MQKEFTRPLEEPIDSDSNVFSVLQDRVHRKGDLPLIQYRSKQGWCTMTAKEVQDKVVDLSKGLIARGIKPGDSVAIISHTRWEWTVLDLAIMSIGAVTVPVYETDSPAQIRRILNDSHVVMAFLEDEEMKTKVDLVRSQCAYLDDVYVISRGALTTMTAYGNGVSEEDFQSRVAAVRGDDLATIVYTSGSTGSPKGIELSHGNIIFTIRSGIQAVPDICLGPDRRLLLCLPLAHAFARCLQYFAIGTDLVLGLTGSIKNLLQDMQTFKPTFILAVPRVFEKIFNAASQKAGTGTRGRIFLDAVKVARQWSRIQQEGGSVPMALRAKHVMYTGTVYEPIQEALGGNVQYGISGGAPLDDGIAHFFNGIGIPLLEGYGMTETMGPVAVNPTEGYRIGTIGLPMPGITVAIDEEGELCIKGPDVCLGYHNHPEITTRQIRDGWLMTGDLGSIDDQGFIQLTGRRKEIIITAGGKNISPAVLETAVQSSPVISQCMVIGDRRPFIAALITLNLDEANRWLQSEGAEPVGSMTEAVANPIIRTEVERAVDAANAQVSQAESIRRFRILDEDFTQEDGLLTPTYKPRRKDVMERYRDLIDKEIYTGTSTDSPRLPVR